MIPRPSHRKVPPQEKPILAGYVDAKGQKKSRYSTRANAAEVSNTFTKHGKFVLFVFGAITDTC